MKIYRFILIAVMSVFALTSRAGEVPQHMYACGGFNSWNVMNPAEFQKDGDIFKLNIDFSGSNLFKISSASTAGCPGSDQAWGVFDQGAYTTQGQARLNQPMPLVAGIDNIKAPVKETLEVRVDMNAMTITFVGEGEEPPTSGYSGTLPVLFIDTENSAPIESKEVYVSATYYLDPMGVEGVKAIGTKDEPLAMQIRGRGNYTWTGFDKKPYRLKLGDKQPLLGMKKSKHFALLAHADDKLGFLRNPVGFKISELIGMNWTPAQEPVEVVLNGSYIGLYFLTETIRVDKDRVNIVEQPDNATDPEVITGGWLVEIDNYDTDPHVTLTEHGWDYPIFFTYKTPEALSGAQEEYLTNQMTQLNNLIYGDKNSNELWNHIDMDQLARYYIVQEIVDDYESFHGSCYLYKQQGNDEKWTFGPVWDFGSAMFYDKSQFIYQDRTWHQVWIGEICKFPAFNDYVKETWKEFCAEHYNELYDYVDAYSSRIAAACVADAARWPQYGNADEASKALYVKTYLAGAQTWLGSQWGMTSPLGEETTVYFCDTASANPWHEVNAFVWDPEAAGYTGMYNPLGGWPGLPMSPTDVEGNPGFAITFTPSFHLSSKARIIFNNGGSGAGNQTDSFPIVNGGVYNLDGLAQVEAAFAPASLKMYGTNGTLYIESPVNTLVNIATLDGRSTRVILKQGVNAVNLPAGFYVVGNQKVLLK